MRTLRPNEILAIGVAIGVAAAVLGMLIGRAIVAAALKFQDITHDDRPSALPAHRVGRWW